MNTCTNCDKEVMPGERFCRHCGTRANVAPAGKSSENELALFVGKNAETYLNRFRRFGQTGEESFALTWHWPAFFFSFWWMVYRKLYGWSILALLLGCVPYLGLLVMIGFGMTANYIYFNHARKKLLEVNALPVSEVERAATIGRTGGVNNLAFIAVPLVVVAFIGIIAAIAIPRYASSLQGAADVQAKREIQQACRIGENVFAGQPGKREIEPDEFLHAGLVRSPEVEMMLLDGRRDTFSISAKHNKGKMLYTSDRQCYLTEVRQE